MVPVRMFDPGSLTPPIAEPAFIALRRATSPKARRGRAIADANPLVAAVRASQPEGPQRNGFDIGMGSWDGQTLDGPGKQALARSLTPEEQQGFAEAGTFSLQWNNDTDFAARGAKSGRRSGGGGETRHRPRNAAGRTGRRPLLAGIRHRDILGDPKLGAQGNTLIGPGSQRIRATLGPDGQQGFNDSLPFNVVRR